MVIKERHKTIKNPHKAEGFMLLEAVALVGFVALVSIEITSLHGLIMNTYHETALRMRALSHAENVMASTLTGVSSSAVVEAYSSSAGDSFNGLHVTSGSHKELLFKSEITKTHGVSFLPTQKPFMVVTVKVLWREQGLEKKIELTRLVADE